MHRPLRRGRPYFLRRLYFQILRFLMLLNSGPILGPAHTRCRPPPGRNPSRRMGFVPLSRRHVPTPRACLGRQDWRMPSPRLRCPIRRRHKVQWSSRSLQIRLEPCRPRSAPSPHHANPQRHVHQGCGGICIRRQPQKPPKSPRQSPSAAVLAWVFLTCGRTSRLRRPWGTGSLIFLNLFVLSPKFEAQCNHPISQVIRRKLIAIAESTLEPECP